VDEGHHLARAARDPPVDRGRGEVNDQESHEDLEGHRPKAARNPGAGENGLGKRRGVKRITSSIDSK